MPVLAIPFATQPKSGANTNSQAGRSGIPPRDLRRAPGFAGYSPSGRAASSLELAGAGRSCQTSVQFGEAPPEFRQRPLGLPNVAHSLHGYAEIALRAAAPHSRGFA